MEEDLDMIFKVVLVGDPGVGKTVLLGWYADGVFIEDTWSTIGVDFKSLDFNIKGKMVKAQFWDTAGQDKYNAMSEAYFWNAHGAFILYDVTNENSFTHVEDWYEKVK